MAEVDKERALSKLEREAIMKGRTVVMHTPFYFKLNSLNQKIKMFKDIFYTSKRSQDRDKRAKEYRKFYLKMLKTGN